MMSASGSPRTLPATASQLVAMHDATDLQLTVAFATPVIQKYGAANAALIDQLERAVCRELLLTRYRERAVLLLHSVLPRLTHRTRYGSDQAS